MITLRKAIKEGKLKQFIREHAKDKPGDMEKLDKALKRPASGYVKGMGPGICILTTRRCNECGTRMKPRYQAGFCRSERRGKHAKGCKAEPKT